MPSDYFRGGNRRWNGSRVEPGAVRKVRDVVTAFRVEVAGGSVSVLGVNIILSEIGSGKVPIFQPLLAIMRYNANKILSYWQLMHESK